MAETSLEIPQYLEQTYAWAYLYPSSLRVFDHAAIVSAILWGNFHQLENAVLAEVPPGQKVLQAACVYGPFSEHLAQRIGSKGRLDIVDVVPVQVENCARKLERFPQARARVADAADPGDETYDRIVCFFLLHELPDVYKRRVVDSLLSRLAPDGRVVFVDYHEPRPLHPLRPVTALVFRYLEPFARSLWHHEIRDFATCADEYAWHQETYFGGLFQKVVVRRLDDQSTRGND